MDPQKPDHVDKAAKIAFAHSPRRKRRLAVAALGLAFISFTGASAASLGGLGARSVGADRGTVSSCDTNGVRVVYGPLTYNAAVSGFVMSTFSVRQIAAACRGRTLAATFRTSPGSALSSLSAVVTGARVNFTFGSPIPVSQIAGIALAIS